MTDVAFIGLGVMGGPMARHLAARGHTITVYNRTRARAAAWVAAHGGRAAVTPREAAAGSAFVGICVGNDDDLRSVVLGPDGVLAGAAPGTVVIDHTTASADVARTLHALALERQVHFVDAPVSGGQVGAEKGALTVMCGGDAGACERAAPIIEAYARACLRIGGPGSGQLAKMVNQICIAGLLQALAEGMAFGSAAGLDMEAVLAAIGKGAAQSWQLDNRAPTMLRGKFDFGFAVDWMRKDLGLCLAEGRRNGARLPVTALVDQFYAAVQAAGGGRLDTSSLHTLLAPRPPTV